jgi:hypothetical protein
MDTGNRNKEINKKEIETSSWNCQKVEFMKE